MFSIGWLSIWSVNVYMYTLIPCWQIQQCSYNKAGGKTKRQGPYIMTANNQRNLISTYYISLHWCIDITSRLKLTSLILSSSMEPSCASNALTQPIRTAVWSVISPHKFCSCSKLNDCNCWVWTGYEIMSHNQTHICKTTEKYLL